MKTKKRLAASSRRGKLIVKSDADIRAFAKSPAAKAMSERLRAQGPEPSAKDLEEIPALTDDQLARMYRPVKQKVTVRLDADVLAWLKSGSGHYQTRINSTLREAMLKRKIS
ncbi:MAG TPA: BrnA antitoxin family protein [Bryobacteraceae bacterium]|nr:BrnA antitoxin family protein [Bryobacteraceae bacterium]